MTDPTKPHQVVIAGRIMWTLWALGVAVLLLALGVGITQSQQVPVSWMVMFAIAMSSLGLLGLLIRFVMKGRNWARITYALVACLAIAALGLGLLLRPHFTWTGIAMPIALIGAYAAILRLLFHSASTPWFRRDDRSST